MSVLWNFYESLSPLHHFIGSFYHFPVYVCVIENYRDLFFALYYLILFIFKEIAIQLEKNLPFIETSFLYKREG